MSRIRTIKPEFFLDSKLAKKSPLCRLFFIGLWNQADKNGVLEEDQERLKVQILPYDKANVEALLSELEPDFIVCYETNGKQYILILNFKKHQRPHPKEADTGYPLPTIAQQSREIKLQAVKLLAENRVVAGGKGREGVSFPLDTGIGKGSKDGVTASVTPYQQAVDHILKTYKAGPGKGMPYPFSGTDGKAVKRLLGLYGVDDCLALWDEFLFRDWDWLDKSNKRVRVPRDLRVFESKLTELLEDGGFKRRVQSVKTTEEKSAGLTPLGDAVSSILKNMEVSI